MQKLKQIVLLSLVTTLLIGCSERSGGGVARDSSGNEITPVLHVWMEGSLAEETWLQAVGREFVANSSVKGLKIQVTRFNSEERLQNAFLDAMAAGRGPDMIYTDARWLAYHRDKLYAKPSDEIISVSQFNDTFVPAARDYLTTANQELYGVPLVVDTLAVLYNEQQILDRLPNRNKPGTTWPEFRQDIERLTEQDDDEIEQAGAAIGRLDNITRGAEVLENIMWQQGARFFDPATANATLHESVVSDPQGKRLNAGVAGFEYFTRFGSEDYKQYTWSEDSATAQAGNQDWQTFIEGDVSMIFATATDLQAIKTKITKIPQRERGISLEGLALSPFPDSDQKPIIANIKALVVTKAAPYPNTTWRFLRFMLKPSYMEKLFTDTQLPPARIDLIAKYRFDKELGVYLQQAKQARAHMFFLPEKDIYEALETLVNATQDNPRFSIKRALDQLAQGIDQEVSIRQKLQKMIQR